MTLISDNYHYEKLKKNNINIKTKYIVGNKILERNTDRSINDDIINGVRCEKQYYLNNKLVTTEKLFDTRIEYSYVSKEIENKEYHCPNCGNVAILKNVLDGCPYCGTYYNIDYTNKELGNKYHYDHVLKSPIYKIVTAIIDLIISILLSYIFIKLTSRTFNEYDISKIFIYGLILATILYYFFYIMDAYIVLTPIKKYKDKQNQKQIDFWNRTKIDQKIFFNNFNYELGKYLYSKENIIDYDIIDYLSYKEKKVDNVLNVELNIEIRIVYFENNKIFSKILEQTYTMIENANDKLKLDKEVNIIMCPNCGASIDATSDKCKYCDTLINSFQSWFLKINNK